MRFDLIWFDFPSHKDPPPRGYRGCSITLHCLPFLAALLHPQFPSPISKSINKKPELLRCSLYLPGSSHLRLPLGFPGLLWGILDFFHNALGRRGSIPLCFAHSSTHLLISAHQCHSVTVQINFNRIMVVLVVPPADAPSLLMVSVCVWLLHLLSSSPFPFHMHCLVCLVSSTDRLVFFLTRILTSSSLHISLGILDALSFFFLLRSFCLYIDSIHHIVHSLHSSSLLFSSLLFSVSLVIFTTAAHPHSGFSFEIASSLYILDYTTLTPLHLQL